ncbi:hypothetical protein pb186bvf_014304 [Paramecium bursaria]
MKFIVSIPSTLKSYLVNKLTYIVQTYYLLFQETLFQRQDFILQLIFVQIFILEISRISLTILEITKQYEQVEFDVTSLHFENELRYINRWINVLLQRTFFSKRRRYKNSQRKKADMSDQIMSLCLLRITEENLRKSDSRKRQKDRTQQNELELDQANRLRFKSQGYHLKINEQIKQIQEKVFIHYYKKDNNLIKSMKKILY